MMKKDKGMSKSHPNKSNKKVFQKNEGKPKPKGAYSHHGKGQQNKKHGKEASSAATTTSGVTYLHNAGANSAAVSAAPTTQRKLSELQQKFAKKLEGSRFRIINEQLYTTKGDESLTAFQSDPSLFDVYHTGFRAQVESWPENPLDGIISWIQKYHSTKVIADMGCGEGRLALDLKKKTKNTVHSFDLVSRHPHITAADIAHVPLPDSSVDIVVFCLSLMGTNIGDFIREANRILKVGGILKIVEVRSRFEKESDGIKKFIRIVKKLGFSDGNEKSSSAADNQNKMFFELECVKISDSDRSVDFTAGACVYKKR